MSRAQLVVVNGGGYDDFLSHLLANASAGTRVLDAADASGPHRSAGAFNEHLWYGLPAAAHGFRDPQHVVDVFGWCSACSG